MFWKASEASDQRQICGGKELCHHTWCCRCAQGLEVPSDLVRCCPDHKRWPDLGWQHQSNQHQHQKNTEPDVLYLLAELTPPSPFSD